MPAPARSKKAIRRRNYLVRARRHVRAALIKADMPAWQGEELDKAERCLNRALALK